MHHPSTRVREAADRFLKTVVLSVQNMCEPLDIDHAQFALLVVALFCAHGLFSVLHT